MGILYGRKKWPQINFSCAFCYCICPSTGQIILQQEIPRRCYSTYYEVRLIRARNLMQLVGTISLECAFIMGCQLFHIASNANKAHLGKITFLLFDPGFHDWMAI